MILASISMQVLAILASLHVVWNTIIYGSPVDVTKEIVRNQLNGLIEHDSIACSDKIVQKHKFLFKLSLVNYHIFYGNTKNLHDCPDLGCYFIIISD
jgi:hypothetical protein